jgi:hypothetical protein
VRDAVDDNRPARWPYDHRAAAHGGRSMAGSRAPLGPCLNFKEPLKYSRPIRLRWHLASQTFFWLGAKDASGRNVHVRDSSPTLDGESCDVGFQNDRFGGATLCQRRKREFPLSMSAVVLRFFRRIFAGLRGRFLSFLEACCSPRAWSVPHRAVLRSALWELRSCIAGYPDFAPFIAQLASGHEHRRRLAVRRCLKPLACMK